MGSLSEYQRSAGAVHSIVWHLVWCPKYRKRVLVGAVAAVSASKSHFVASLRRVSEATIRKYIDETTRPTRGKK